MLPILPGAEIAYVIVGGAIVGGLAILLTYFFGG